MPPNRDESRGDGDSEVESGSPSFEQWRGDFLSDAQAHGLLRNAELIGDVSLRLFWKQGMAPTVQALLADEKQK